MTKHQQREPKFEWVKYADKIAKDIREHAVEEDYEELRRNVLSGTSDSSAY